MGKVSCAFDGYNVQCNVYNARGRMIQCSVFSFTSQARGMGFWEMIILVPHFEFGLY